MWDEDVHYEQVEYEKRRKAARERDARTAFVDRSRLAAAQAERWSSYLRAWTGFGVLVALAGAITAVAATPLGSVAPVLAAVVLTPSPFVGGLLGRWCARRRKARAIDGRVPATALVPWDAKPGTEAHLRDAFLSLMKHTSIPTTYGGAREAVLTDEWRVLIDRVDRVRLAFSLLAKAHEDARGAAMRALVRTLAMVRAEIDACEAERAAEEELKRAQAATEAARESAKATMDLADLTARLEGELEVDEVVAPPGLPRLAS